MDKIAYFDHAATSFPKPEAVYAKMDAFYRKYGVNVSRGQNKLADQAGAMVSHTRDMLLDLFHCPTKRVIFTPSATEGINLVLRGLPWSDGQVVYISPFEHNAVLRTLNYIKMHYAIQIRELHFAKDSMLYDLERIRYQFQEQPPHVVAVSHASNVFGIVAPVAEIFGLAKKYRATTLLDMAQTAGLIDINLQNTNVDYAVFAGHKTLYGPFGIAGIITAKAETLPPLIYGGTGIDSANPNMPEAVPEKLEAGSSNVAAIAGLHAALEWNRGIGIDNIHAKEEENKNKLLTILHEYPNITVFESCAPQIGVISCKFKGLDTDNAAQALSGRDVAVRGGLHCAPSAHRCLGTFPMGTVRLSVNYFTDDEDFTILKEALDFIEENS